MVDPVTLGTIALSAAGSAGAGLFASKMGKSATPALPAIPPGLQPATTPGAKPQAKGQQQSFMSGAAIAQQSLAGAASGGTKGKSLIGA